MTKQKTIISKKLTWEQEQELARRIVEGDAKAREILITSNLPLVTHLAKNYKGNGVDMDDLVGAGRVGLMQAVDKYQPGHRAKFGTFAQSYINSNIKSVLSELSGAVSMSNGTYDRQKKIKKAKEELGENATVEQVMQKCGRKKRTDAFNHAMRSDVACNHKVSLDARVSSVGEDKRTYMDVIEEECDESMESRVHDERMEAMFHALKKLDEKERYVIVNSFGMNDSGEKLTLDDMSRVLNVSKEYVRQIREKVLLKMKSLMTMEEC